MLSHAFLLSCRDDHYLTCTVLAMPQGCIPAYARGMHICKQMHLYYMHLYFMPALSTHPSIAARGHGTTLHFAIHYACPVDSSTIPKGARIITSSRGGSFDKATLVKQER